MIKDRQIHIDIAKGLTILLVVYGHLHNPINEFIYSFHMPAFFFMSGMFAKKMSIKDTILIKGRRLLLPFLFYYIYMLVMKTGRLLLSGKYRIESFSPLNEDAVYYLIGPIWFLVALYYIFIIYALVSRFKIAIKCLAVIILSIVPFMYLGSNPLYINSALLGCSFFFLGKVYHNLLGGGGISNKTVLPIVAILLLVYLLLFSPCENAISFNQTDANYLQFVSCGLVGTLLILIISVLIEKWNSRVAVAISNIGRMSLHIMALHLPLCVYIFNIIALIGKRYTSENIFENYTANFCVFIIVTILSYYLGCLIQKFLFNKFNI